MAAAPLTRLAVVAAFASTQEAAATVTVRQIGSGCRPVVGSTMWWTWWSPSCQYLDAIPDVREAARFDRHGFGCLGGSAHVGQSDDKATWRRRSGH